MSEENPLAVAKIVSPKERERTVPLEYPIEFDGKTYDAIRVRRVTGREVEEFMRALADDGAAMPPMVDCPRAVYDAMDDDDRFEVDQAMLDFLPRRLKVAAGSILADGEPASGS